MNFLPTICVVLRRNSKHMSLCGLCVLLFVLLAIRTISTTSLASAQNTLGASGAMPDRSIHKTVAQLDAVSRSHQLQRDLFDWERLFPTSSVVISSPVDVKTVLRVQAIVVGRDAHAIINGHVYRIGDNIDDFHVSKIEQRCIVVEKDDLVYELRIGD